MNDYRNLDKAILQKIPMGFATQTLLMYQGQLREVCQAFGDAATPKRSDDRVMDGRLQSLRKRGLIEYRKGRWWLVLQEKSGMTSVPGA